MPCNIWRGDSGYQPRIRITTLWSQDNRKSLFWIVVSHTIYIWGCAWYYRTDIIIPKMHQWRSPARTQETTTWIVSSQCDIYLNLNWKCSWAKWIEFHSFLLRRFNEFIDSNCNNETQIFLHFHKHWVTHRNKYWRNCSTWLALLHSPHDFNHHMSE